MSKVIIDARMVGAVPHGIARYVARLASGLRKLQSAKGLLPYEPVFLVNPSEYSQDSFENWPVLRARSKFLSPMELVELPKLLRGAGIYHSPSFSSLFSSGPLKPSCPWIVTIHDLNHLTFGSRMQKVYYDRLLKPFAQKAAAVTTVSEFSRSEIEPWLSRENIEVVYNAMDAESLDAPSEVECQKTLSRMGLERGKFLLCLSNSKPHKNIPFLIEAYRLSKIDWPLVLSMNEFGDVPGVRAVGGLPDADVRVLRACAGAMVFPSLYEGFGLPPLEAVLSRTPLIVSQIAPHQEGLSDLGPDEVRWIDPRDSRSLVDALVSVRDGRIIRASEASRQKLIDRFSDLQMATHMDRIYRRVLEISP